MFSQPHTRSAAASRLENLVIAIHLRVVEEFDFRAERHTEKTDAQQARLNRLSHQKIITGGTSEAPI
jgi:hypothetical protein